MKLNDAVQKMRADWDARAANDSKYYIASWRKDWDTESFFASGETDVRELFDAFLAENQFDPGDKVVLEIGCGIGRMTRAFAGRFHMVVGTDVSKEMLVQAATNLADHPNVFLSLGSGYDLAQFGSNRFNACFSHIVFQHIPDPAITLNYLREIGRVLQPGGLFKVHLRSRQTQLLFRWAWRVRHSLYRFAPGRRIPILDKYDQFNELRPEKIESWQTWSGSAVSWRDLDHVLRAAGLSYEAAPAGPGGQFWVYGSKNEASHGLTNR